VGFSFRGQRKRKTRKRKKEATSKCCIVPSKSTVSAHLQVTAGLDGLSTIFKDRKAEEEEEEEVNVNCVQMLK